MSQSDFQLAIVDSPLPLMEPDGNQILPKKLHQMAKSPEKIAGLTDKPRRNQKNQ